MMRTRDDRPWTGRRAGGIVVEAAMLLALVVVLVLAIDAGRAWFTYGLLTHAVREGARRAAVKPSLQVDDREILDLIDATLRDGGIHASARSVTFTSPLQTGRVVRIRAEVEFQPVLVMLSPSGAALPLRTEIVARYE